MDDIAIKVEHVSKTFKLPHERTGSIKNAVINFARHKKGYENQRVLKDISFEIKKSEFFGIVGRNGSGKSTLLKLLAGIYTPDGGNIQVNGKLTPFIELGVGFNPELTGRENVFLNGALLGFNRKEMLAMYDDIVEFAELRKFMDQRLKNYSSGMQVRLAFSIAIRAESPILLLDEVLAVGDEAFQRKCFDYFAKLKGDKKTVVLVTHDMDSVQRFCNRAMYIEKGKIMYIGNTREAARAYEKANISAGESIPIPAPDDSTQKSTEGVELNVSLKNQSNKQSSVFYPGDKLVFDIDIASKIDIRDAVISMEIQQTDGLKVYRVATEDPNESLGAIKKGIHKRIHLEIDNIFAENTYHINVFMRSIDRSTDYIWKPGVNSFRVIVDTFRGKWSLRPPYTMRIDSAKGK